MSADLVNLRQARKARARVDKAADAAQNRAKFSRTRAERDTEALGKARAARRLDGHRLQPAAAVDGDAT